MTDLYTYLGVGLGVGEPVDPGTGQLIYPTEMYVAPPVTQVAEAVQPPGGWFG